MQIEYWEADIWKVNEFNFLNEEVEEFSNRWCPNLVNVRSPSYLKQKTFKYCIDYIFGFSFWHGYRIELTFQQWFVKKKKNGVLNAAGAWGKAKVPLTAAGPGQNHAVGPENSILTAQKAIDYLIIYSFSTSNLVLPE